MSQQTENLDRIKDLLNYVSGFWRKEFFKATPENRDKILEFAKTIKDDVEFCKPAQKELTVIALFKRVIPSLSPDVQSRTAVYKQPITFKIVPRHISEWELTSTIQRDEEFAIKNCADTNELPYPKREGLWTCIPILISTKTNAEFVRSPQFLSYDMSKNAWWKEFVDVEFGKKVRIHTEEAVEILSSGRSIGFMSEDFSKKFV